MRKVEKYISEDGQVYDDESSCWCADVAYWKGKYLVQYRESAARKLRSAGIDSVTGAMPFDSGEEIPRHKGVICPNIYDNKFEVGFSEPMPTSLTVTKCADEMEQRRWWQP